MAQDTKSNVTDQSFTLTPPKDIELGTARPRPLTYQVATPEGKAKGLVFFIRGFGEDNNAEYAGKMRQWIASEHGYACATVDYHAIFNRPHNGGRLAFEDIGIYVINEAMGKYGIAPSNDVNAVLNQINEANSQSEVPEKIVIPCAIFPGHDELQNFGVLQAMDHLAVYADLIGKIDFDPHQVIALGSSHGGYIANMISKLAPGLLSAVIDSCGYARPPEHYLVGEEVCNPEWTFTLSSTCFIACYVKSAWTLKPDQPNTHHEDARAIRSFLIPEHIEQMVAKGKRTQYRYIHGHVDDIAPPDDKKQMVQLMQAAGLDVTLDIVTPDRVDGKFIKDMGHGMGISLRALFEHMLPSLNPTPETAGEAVDITYTGQTRTYHFANKKGGLTAALSSND